MKAKLMGYFDIAQVCPNGHVINDSVRRSPQFSKQFCDMCGEKTTTVCQNCNSPIQGQYHAEGVISIGDYMDKPPAFCANCGNAYEWTTRKQRAAIELFLEESMGEESNKEFEGAINEITKDTAQAQVASKKITRLLTNVATGTANAIRDIVVDIAAESVKRTMFN